MQCAKLTAKRLYWSFISSIGRSSILRIYNYLEWFLYICGPQTSSKSKCVCAAVYPIAQEIRSCEDSTQTSKNRQETNILRTYFLEVLLGILYSWGRKHGFEMLWLNIPEQPIICEFGVLPELRSSPGFKFTYGSFFGVSDIPIIGWFSY